MISVEDCAKALKLSERRVQILCTQKRIKAVKISGVWVISDYSKVKLRPGAGRPRKDAK
jgi:hypothetical protein